MSDKVYTYANVFVPMIRKVFGMLGATQVAQRIAAAASHAGLRG